MVNRLIHYEAAFEHYLRQRQTPYVAVDEAKKALFANASLKSFDFVVYSSQGPNLLVDVKGRKFPYTSGGQRRYWENWVEQADLLDLARWEEIFGQGFQGLLVFAYHLGSPELAAKFTDIIEFRDQHYGFVAAPSSLYASHARQRSRSWQTVTMSVPLFRELSAGVSAFI